MFQSTDHTFMICAYKENPYLEDCIQSVLGQTVLGEVKISTSTPNGHIKKLAEKYNLPMIVNNGCGDNVDNFNFAYANANTRLVTLCHQDDYFFPNYLEEILRYANIGRAPIILHTNYCEDRDGILVRTNRILKVKRLINFPLRFRATWKNKWLRRKSLSLGCAVCCPSVTLCKDRVPDNPFTSTYKGNIDWDAWLRLASLNGDFIYCPKQLVVHRIWSESTTSSAIRTNERNQEDYEILKQLWPAPIAKIICRVYSTAEKSNDLR